MIRQRIVVEEHHGQRFLTVADACLLVVNHDGVLEHVTVDIRNRKVTPIILVAVAATHLYDHSKLLVGDVS